MRPGSGTGSGDYVLRLHDGDATLVASGEDDGPGGAPCTVNKPVDARRFPCPLPRALGYHAGALVLAGAGPFVVRIRVS